MEQARSNHDQSGRRGGTPLFVAIVIAVLGTLAILIVNHGPWNKPRIQPAVISNYGTTGEAARAAGARVVPTEPELLVEPKPAGPKPVHPVNPLANPIDPSSR
jgi:hypothetical protein